MSQWDRVSAPGPDGERWLVPDPVEADVVRPHELARQLDSECDRLRAEIARLHRVCEDKERHMDGWRRAADEDRAIIRVLAEALEQMVRWTERHGLNVADLIDGRKAEVPVVTIAKAALAKAKQEG